MLMVGTKKYSEPPNNTAGDGWWSKLELPHSAFFLASYLATSHSRSGVVTSSIPSLPSSPSFHSVRVGAVLMNVLQVIVDKLMLISRPRQSKYA